MGAQTGQQGWFELPFWRLIKYVLYGVLIGALAGYVFTRFVNLDYLILAFHVQNLWLLVPEGVVLTGTAYIWNWSRNSQKKKRQRQAKEQLDKLMSEARR